MFGLPQMNQMVDVGELAKLNEALRKSAEVGYQTPAGTAGASMQPLVPQSLEGTLASATYTMKELCLWPAIPKKSVAQTVHEFTRIEEHGADLDPFMAEGGIPARNASSYTRESVRVKYLAERREVTDVATMVGIIGSNANAIAEETQRGTLRLMQKLERSLFHADSTVDSLQFDGVIPQIEAYDSGANTNDVRGATVSPLLLQEILGEVYSAPRFGRPDCIYVEPRVHANLIQQAVAHGRHDQVKVSDGALTYGQREIYIMAPYGAVPIKAAPFLFTAYEPPAAAAGNSSPNTPTTAGGSGAPPSTSGSGSFVAADAGDYYYKIVAVGNGGHSAAFKTANVTVAAGDAVTMTLNDAAVSDVRYYRVYRSAKGVDGDYKFMKEVAYGAGAGADTVITDDNSIIPGTSKILFVEHNPDIFEFIRLLDFLRRPLAETATSKPFLLMLFGSPLVKVPSKCWVTKNVGTAGLLS